MNSLAREKIHFRVAKEIEKYIGVNNLSEGDPLPSENQLTEILQISRSSLREGLRLLEGMGMIEVRQGKGIFVSSTKKTTITLEVKTDRQSFLDVLGVRRVLESEAALLAIQNGTEEDIEKIRRAYEALVAASADGQDTSMLDYDFHIAINNAGHNAYLNTLIESIYYIFLHAWKEQLGIRETFVTTLPLHERLVKAVEAKDSAEAVWCIGENIRHNEEAVKKFIK